MTFLLYFAAWACLSWLFCKAVDYVMERVR